METAQPLPIRVKILGYLFIVFGVLSAFELFSLELLLWGMLLRAVSGFSVLLGIGLLRRWHWARDCTLALLWPFLIFLPLLVFVSLASPEALDLKLSWGDRPIAEAQTSMLVAIWFGGPALMLWLLAIWCYRVLARVRELDAQHFWRIVCRWALVGFIAAMTLGFLLSAFYKEAGIPQDVAAGCLTPGMACWQLLVSAMPGLEPFVKTEWSFISVSVFFTDLLVSLLAGGTVLLNLRLKKVQNE